MNNMNSVTSWYDLPNTDPIDPRSLIANTNIGATQGKFARSATFLQTSWVTSPIIFTGVACCISLHGDDQLTVNNAAQWDFSHQIANVSSAIAPPMRKVLFVRGGIQWEMNIEMDFGSNTYTDLQLSLRDNSATSGDFQNSPNARMPVISFQGNFTGIQMLRITLSQYGRFSLVLVAQDTSTSQYSAFEIDLIVIP